jgi:subtilase family serine protease
MLCKRAFLTVFSVLALLGASGTCPVFGAGWKTLPGHVPRELSKLTPNGRLAATNQLRLAIGVPLRDPAGLDNFLAQVSDPASSNYRQYLSPAEFTTRFGPTEADYQAVKDFARTNGLAVTATYGNRLVLDVAGPVAAVEKAFHITLHTYRHPTEARDFFAPDTEPAVDAALPVVDISGLSNFKRPHPNSYKLPATQQKSVTAKGGSGASGTYMGADFRAAYAPGVTLRGSGQAVGLMEFDGYYANDITSYESLSGYTNVPLANVLLNGVSGNPGFSGLGVNAIGEVSLDIEMAVAMAPALAKVVVYEGALQNSILSQMASDNQARQISSSWGWGGGPNPTTDSIFKQMISQGQSFFNASGDSDAFTTGATSVNGVDNPSNPNGGAPSSSPYITQVGGTTLTTGTGAAYASETVWNWGGGIGSSGGISSYYTNVNTFSWQTNILNMAARGGSATNRNIPDVALTADNVFVIYNNGQSAGFGGTSCAAPLWAGFIALVNQQAATAGQPPVGFVNPTLYAIAAGPNYSACFHDVTTGNNFSSSSPGLFSAMNGYDLCTGLGTPAGQSLINALAGGNSTNTLVIAPQNGAAAGVAGGPFTITAGNFLLTNTSGSALTWSLVNPSAWLQISPVGGTLAAHGNTSLAASLTATASNLVVGTYPAILVFSNATAHAVQTGLFTLQVSQPMTISPTNGFTAAAPVGGGFAATAQNYLLGNLSGNSLAWSLVNTSSWLSVSPASGQLAAGAQTSVTVSLTTVANSLAAGIYSANVLATNNTGVAAVLPFTVNVGQPLVVNGGFETGDFTGWTETGSTTYMSVSTTAGYVHAGSYGAELGPSGALSYLSQNLATTPGANYLLSCWLANPKTGTPNQFLVQWNGATIYNQTNLSALAWTNLQFLVTATGTSTPLQFGFRNDPAYFGFDDVSVTPLAPAAFMSTIRAANNFQLAWNTTTGIVYQVQYKTNLLQANWINLGAATTAKTTSLTVTDTNAFLNSPRRFYRLVVQP